MTDSAPRIARRRLFVGVALFVVVAAGTAAGHAAWSLFVEHRARQHEDRVRAEAAAFKASPQGRARAAVQRQLYDPEAAIFKDEHASKKSPDTWCGLVNGRNRMGGMVGFRRYAVDLGPDDLDGVLDQAHVDYDSHDPDMQRAFEGAYAVRCP